MPPLSLHKMAPRKKVKKKINDETDCSVAANKRRRLELLNSTTGVPFTSPISQFPSFDFFRQQRNQPPQTTAIHTDLNLCPPLTTHHDEEAAADDDQDHFNSLIPPQNFLIGYHINQMRLSMEEFWRRNFGEEIKKRKETEARLKEKEESADRLRKMYHFYEERTFLLEEMLQRRVAGEGPVAAVREEEVESCFVDRNSAPRTDIACENCRSRRATMLWLPCRHLCVCLVCERRVKACPICGVQKAESFMINLPLP